MIEIDAAEFGLAANRLTLKLELLQHYGSFKARGAFTNLLGREVPAAGVVAASGGNHGAAVAYAAMKLGKKATIFVPEVSPAAKLERIRGYGAELVVGGARYAEALAASEDFAATTGALQIHAFNQEETLIGQGTLGLEIVQDWPEVDAVVVPIGGGGLISGVSMAVKSHNPKARIIGVESSDGPAMKMSVAAGHLETIDCKTIIDGLRVRRVGEITFSVVQRFVDEIVALPDREIFEAVIWIMERCKLVVEGAAAAPVAALMRGLVKLPKGSRVAVVLSGGNVNLDQLRSLKWN